MKSIFTTLGRIVIILAVAALIVAGVSSLTSSTGDTSSTMGQPPAFDESTAASMPARPDHDEGGSSAFGLLELVKNVGVTGLIITAYWFLQKWTSQIKRTSRLAM